MGQCESGVGLEGGTVGTGGGAATAAFPPKILYIPVPQVGQAPLMALRPFFVVSSTPLAISFLALHLKQYPSGIKNKDCWLHASQSGAQPNEGRSGAQLETAGRRTMPLAIPSGRHFPPFVPVTVRPGANVKPEIRNRNGRSASISWA